MTDFASVLILMGVGGIAGALATLVSAGGRIATDFGVFKEAYTAYRRDKSPANEVVLSDAFDELDAAIGGFGSAFERLKRAFRSRR